MTSLRPYQLDAIERIRRAWIGGARRVRWMPPEAPRDLKAEERTVEEMGKVLP